MSEKLSRKDVEQIQLELRAYTLVSPQRLLELCHHYLASLEPSAEREAGFAEGIEAAAKVCDGLADGRRHVPVEGKKEQYQRASQDCAHTIRALSQPRANGDANG